MCHPFGSAIPTLGKRCFSSEPIKAHQRAGGDMNVQTIVSAQASVASAGIKWW